MGNRLLMVAWAVAFVYSLTQAWPLFFPPSPPMQVVSRVARAPVVLNSPIPESSGLFLKSFWPWVLGLASVIAVVLWCYRRRSYLQEKTRREKEDMDARFGELQDWMNALEGKISGIRFDHRRIMAKELESYSGRIAALEARLPEEKKSEEPPREQKPAPPKKQSAELGMKAVQDVLEQLERGY